MKRDLPGDQVEDVKDAAEDEEDDDTDASMINVDFEFFDLNATVDFHALNTLLKQLLGPDSTKFELGALADLILEQPVGSTVKVDGEETDPYAFLSVINMNANHAHEQVKLLRDYILSKAKSDEKCYNLLSKLFNESAKSQTGLLLSERLINMPVEVSPPLYRIFLEEIAKKSSADPKLAYSHYALISKSYTEIASKLDEEEDRPKKKSKAGKLNRETFYFHAEDEILIKHAAAHVQFQYSNELPESDSKRAFHEFGIKPSGELIVMTKEQLSKAAAEIQASFPF